jgi:hypothetical protein
MIHYYGSENNNYFQEVNKKNYKAFQFWKIHYYNEKYDLHREEGPAIEYSTGHKEYYYNGEYIDVETDKEFKKYIKMKVFI